jgi:predicted membrane-bound spermidine synthase
VALLRTEAASGMGSLYSADLAGAALGTLVPPLFLLPLIGVSNTFILFCGINVAAGLYIQTGKIKS